MHFDLYKNANGEWAWRLLATNGKNVANGGEGYQRFSAMCRTLRRIFDGSKHSAALEKAIETQQRIIDLHKVRT